jgi:hypothetical protein
VLGKDTPGIVGSDGAPTGLWIDAESKPALARSGPNFPPAETEPFTGAAVPVLLFAVEAEPALNVAVAMAAAMSTE